MIRARSFLTLAAPLAGLALASGCQMQTDADLRHQIGRLEKQTAEQSNQLAAANATIEKLHDQLRTTRGFTAADLELIYYPEKIEIARLSGGQDYDGKPGDDGITVYVRPIDRHHDAVKVAGDIRVELYDLANPPGANLIGVYEVPAAQTSEHWYGKLATYHYTIRCPWRDGPPKHDEITVRVTFVDHLTQRVMTAQTICKIDLGG